MSGKPVVLRDRADRDIGETVAHYLAKAGEPAALGFVDALQRAFRHLARLPASGSPRYAHELDLPGLRTWPLKRYPYLVFYLERDDQSDVWRILHGQRDIPGWLRDAD